jgi:hypothetical protein
MWVYWGAVHWCNDRGLNLQQLFENFRAGLNPRATGCFQTAKQLLFASVVYRFRVVHLPNSLSLKRRQNLF